MLSICLCGLGLWQPPGKCYVNGIKKLESVWLRSKEKHADSTSYFHLAAILPLAANWLPNKNDSGKRPKFGKASSEPRHHRRIIWQPRARLAHTEQACKSVNSFSPEREGFTLATIPPKLTKHGFQITKSLYLGKILSSNVSHIGLVVRWN